MSGLQQAAEVAELDRARAEGFAVVQGDALAVLARLPSASVDAVITDPPYSSGGFTRGDRMAKPSTKYVKSTTFADFTGDNRDQRAYLAWCALWLSEALRVAKPGAPIAVFSDWRQLPTTTDALQAGGWVWRGLAVWDKTEGVRPRLGGFRAQAEFIAWGSAGAFEARDDVGALPGVFRVPVRQADRHHLTGKPTELMRQLVRVCPVGGLVLDPFAGSGTTAVAAVLEGRRCLGVELAAGNVEIARRRADEAAREARGVALALAASGA